MIPSDKSDDLQNTPVKKTVNLLTFFIREIQNMDTQILNPPTSGWSPGEVKAMQPEKIKDQEDATNDTDQRISFFRAVKKYVSNNKGSFCEDLGIVLGRYAGSHV